MNRLQDIYNTVRTHLLTQNAKSMRPSRLPAGDPQCAYRGSGGMKCAVGVLIPDEKYSPSMEGYSVHRAATADAAGVTRVNDGADATAGLMCGDGDVIGVGRDAFTPEPPLMWFSKKEMNLLLALQNCHDVREVHEWKEELDRIARQHGLTVPATVGE